MARRSILSAIRDEQPVPEVVEPVAAPVPQGGSVTVRLRFTTSSACSPGMALWSVP